MWQIILEYPAQNQLLSKTVQDIEQIVESTSFVLRLSKFFIIKNQIVYELFVVFNHDSRHVHGKTNGPCHVLPTLSGRASKPRRSLVLAGRRFPGGLLSQHVPSPRMYLLHLDLEVHHQPIITSPETRSTLEKEISPN